MGGLGNQLFQVSAGLYIANNYDVDIKFVWLEKPSGTRQLKVADLLKPTEISDSRIDRTLLCSARTFAFGSRIIRESSPVDTAISRISEKTSVVYGYFQSVTYPDSIKEILICRMKQSKEFSSLFSSSSVKRIAIHMRFGDYLNNPRHRNFHGVTSVKYYLEAAEYFLDKMPDAEVVIISDEPAIAKSEFCSHFHKRAIPVTVIQGKTDFEDLATLTHSSAIVISNSTFSWWGAWIGSRFSNAQVIAPYPWFADPTNQPTHLLPESWLQLKREFEI